MLFLRQFDTPGNSISSTPLFGFFPQWPNATTKVNACFFNILDLANFWDSPKIYWGSPKTFWGSPMSLVKIFPQSDSRWGNKLSFFLLPLSFCTCDHDKVKGVREWRVVVEIKVIQPTDFWYLSQVLDRNLNNFLVV